MVIELILNLFEKKKSHACNLNGWKVYPGTYLSLFSGQRMQGPANIELQKIYKRIKYTEI